MSQSFPLDVTEEEDAFGFGIREAPSGMRAVVRDLGSGLQAVKVRATDGSIQYAVCDERLHPIYSAARSVEELRTRFPLSR